MKGFARRIATWTLPRVTGAAGAVWLLALLESSMSMLAESEDPDGLASATRELAEIMCNHLLPR